MIVPALVMLGAGLTALACTNQESQNPTSSRSKTPEPKKLAAPEIEIEDVNSHEKRQTSSDFGNSYPDTNTLYSIAPACVTKSRIRLRFFSETPQSVQPFAFVCESDNQGHNTSVEIFETGDKASPEVEMPYGFKCNGTLLALSADYFATGAKNEFTFEFTTVTGDNFSIPIFFAVRGEDAFSQGLDAEIRQEHCQ